MIPVNMTRKPTHPGVFFKHEVLDKHNISLADATIHLGIDEKILTAFADGQSRCSAIMARRLALATGTSIDIWLNMQSIRDIWEAENITEDLGVDLAFWRMGRT